ncbi:hypothetical protein Kpho02_17990 [Kitasatospora phosalacinea]|uniref:Uncharacterized protein n=1 Tax=Kitasatospora phosalacinea TaxID=2065 RepID=A0A9W6V205_9ACTN|nr:hypothetical protein [Kitasatospora phosalacinea]GLW69500.1 hypothetical protein Kpho02_17990 [Kitasatospora phosalacinea]
MSCLLRLLGLAGILWMFGMGVFGHDWSLAGLVIPVSTFVLFVADQVGRSEARHLQEAAAARERERRRAEAEQEAPAGSPAGSDGPPAGSDGPPAGSDGDGPDAIPADPR